VRRALAGVLAAAALLAAAPAALAADCPKTTLAAVENEVMCPVCGTPLALATEAPQANRERAFIQRQVNACRSKDQIKRTLVAQFGDSVLALPGDENSDFGDVLVYVIPGLGVLLALGGVLTATRRWRRRGEDSPSHSGSPSPAGSARLDSDLERYDL
jgi:cytochrome c-type biogenesis protein CcmH